MGEGDVIYLQVKHFDECGRLQGALHGDLISTEIPEKHLLQPGDVLFAAKGSKNFATVFENHNESAVASTSFFTLRLTTQMLLPHFLAWQLNNPNIQTLLKSMASGTAMPSISKQVLENIEIDVPTIERQKAILKISNLRIKEKFIKQEIENLREQKIQQLITNAIK